jgi:hypothetical protein
MVRSINPGDWRLAFGKYAGKTFYDIFDENPAYLDWLAGQRWVYGRTREALDKFLSQPTVADEMDRRFNDEDFRCGGKLTTTHVFFPSLQTTPRFAHGRAEWLPVEWPRRGPRDDDPRPARWISVNTRWARSKADIKRLGEASETDLALADEPAPLPALTPRVAWQLAADFLAEIDNCRSVEDLDRLETDHRIQELQGFLGRPAMAKLREAYRRRRDQVSLLALLPGWKHEAALELMQALDEEPELEPLAREHAADLMDTVDLLRLQAV